MHLGTSVTKKPTRYISIQEFVQYLLDDCSQDNEVDELLRTEFDKMDSDSNGSITAAEIMLARKAKGVTEENIKSEIKDFDTNNDKKIDFNEFVESFNKAVKEKFDNIDTNKDGFIAINDYESKTTEDFTNDIKEVDTNTDGKISFGEFVNNLINTAREEEKEAE